MERFRNHLFLKLIYFFALITTLKAATFDVKIDTERHINVVDTRFLSFTLDPKYLFSDDEKFKSKECNCMAASLTPAYLRIAGPSTKNIKFHNGTFTLTVNSNELKEPLKTMRKQRKENIRSLDVSHDQWEKFVFWAKSIGFDLVFALNNELKTTSGVWNPNTAINMLTVAEQANLTDIYWQLGYECTNQSIEEYLNDLETLRVIRETFEQRKQENWRVVAGDITPCLQRESKSDFKDFITLSNNMMDAVLLNGNSSTQELERMTPTERYQLLRLLSVSDTPLWLTEGPAHHYSELERAADWMTSLGISAKNGFSVYLRELMEEDLYTPTLSFYMALLFKNLVGQKVLNVDIDGKQAILFAHCTSLKRSPVPGAITLYGVNMNDEPAILSIKLSEKEKGGDIMQFVLGHDKNGNIVVNGRRMYYEGDIKPTVKRLRPYKVLFITIPPKSFGFWVLANTKIKACQNSDTNNTSLNQGSEVNSKYSLTSINSKRKDRFQSENNSFKEAISSSEFDVIEDDVNKHKNHLTKGFGNVEYKRKVTRSKRQVGEPDFNMRGTRASLKPTKKRENRLKNRSKLQEKISLLNSRLSNSTALRNNKFRPHLLSEKLLKRNLAPKRSDISKRICTGVKSNKRKRRSVLNQNEALNKGEPTESLDDNLSNESTKQDIKIGKILRRIQKQLRELPLEDIEDKNSLEYISNTIPKKSTDDIEENLRKKSSKGILKSTVEKSLGIVEEINKNFNKLWNSLTLLD